MLYRNFDKTAYCIFFLHFPERISLYPDIKIAKFNDNSCLYDNFSADFV